MHKLFSLFVFAFVLDAAAARADDLGLADFAYGLAVTVPPDATLAEIPLPESVYRKIVFPDARDVRVFNPNGERVRHSLSLPPSTTEQEHYTPPFFPVRGKKNASGSVISVVATDGSQGVRAYLSGTKPDESETAAYLVDLRELQHRESPPAVTSVVVGWSGVPAGVAIQVYVETSDDLQSWTPLRAGTVLGRFQNHGQELVLDRIDLPRTRNAYLKIYTAGGPKWEITSLRLWLEERTLHRWERQWEPARRSVVPEKKDATSVEYTLEGEFPVDRLLVPLRDNQIIDIDVFSRAKSDSVWVRRGSGTVFRFVHAGRDVTSPALKIEPSADHFWKLEAAGKNGLVAALEGVTPQFGWVAHLLRFLPQGPGPYTIAYGSGRATASDVNGEFIEATVRRALHNEKPIIGRATMVSAMTLGGEAQRSIPTAGERAIALWAILIGCVAFFGFIAWRLFREMKNGGAPS